MNHGGSFGISKVFFLQPQISTRTIKENYSIIEILISTHCNFENAKIVSPAKTCGGSSVVSAFNAFKKLETYILSEFMSLCVVILNTSQRNGSDGDRIAAR